MRPVNIPSQIVEIWKALPENDRIRIIKDNYKRLKRSETYDVSIVIPAFNEEKNILKTLHSLSVSTTSLSVEIIVVNNNSTDATDQLVTATGVKCILEQKKGITAARNAGLQAARGEFILNADADAIYPSDWIDEMVKPLKSGKNIAVTYGRFAFLPIGATSRPVYFFYEYFADAFRYLNKYVKEEAVNVYGFNSGYRRLQGIKVNGYEHPPGSNEDGWLALKLREKGFGKLYYVTNIKALVWTTDRRIQMEGGFFKGLLKRIKKNFFLGKNIEIRADL